MKRHGNCTLCMLSSYFISSVFFANANSDVYIPPLTAKVFGYVVIYFQLCISTWLNVMCYDIWNTIRNQLKKASASVDESKNSQHKFLYYSLYAWGCALILILVMIICENVASIPITYKPNISNLWMEKYVRLGKPDKIFVMNSAGVILYFNTPIVMCHIVSFYFMVSATYTLRKLKIAERKTFGNVYIPKCAQIKTYTNQLKINWKMFSLIMIPILLSTIIHYLDYFDHKSYKIYDFFLNATYINYLTGLWIFIVFVLLEQSAITVLTGRN